MRHRRDGAVAEERRTCVPAGDGRLIPGQSATAEEEDAPKGATAEEEDAPKGATGGDAAAACLPEVVGCGVGIGAAVALVAVLEGGAMVVHRSRRVRALVWGVGLDSRKGRRASRRRCAD